MIPFFRWSKPKQVEEGKPYGLNPDQINHLADLSEKPGYRIFAKTLRDIAEARGVGLLTYKDPALVHYEQGYITALRFVLELIPNLVEQDAGRKPRPKDRSNGEPDKRSLYGTAFWDSIYGTRSDG